MRAGDEGALAALYDHSAALVYGVALRILGNREDAEEVTLDVYRQIWRDSWRFDPGRGTVAAWLVTLARSRALDYSRRRPRAGVPLETQRDPADLAPNPEDAAALAQFRRRVRRALEALAAAERQAIELACFGDLTHAEIARALGQPLGTVKTRIRRGLERLREQLGGRPPSCP